MAIQNYQMCKMQNQGCKRSKLQIQGCKSAEVMNPAKFQYFIAVFHQSIPELRGTLHENVGDVELERLLVQEWMPWTGLDWSAKSKLAQCYNNDRIRCVDRTALGYFMGMVLHFS